MSRLNRKLYSKSGATIVLALIFLLVTVMIGILLLTSSVTTIERISSKKEEQQAYLAVSSAAQMIVDELSSSENIYSGYINDVYDVDENKNKIEEKNEICLALSTTNTDFAKGVFGPLINKGVHQLENSIDPDEKYVESFTVSVNGIDDVEPVNGIFTMSKDKETEEHNIVIELEDSEKYKCTILLNGLKEIGSKLYRYVNEFGKDVSSSVTYTDVGKGNGHYVYNEIVEWIGNGEGDRTPKTFEYDKYGDFVVDYTYVGDNKGSYKAVGIKYVEGNKDGELQAVYTPNQGKGNYTYEILLETEEAESTAEIWGYDPVYTPTDEGTGNYKATDFEPSSNGDSLGIYKYGVDSILTSYKYTADWDTFSKSSGSSGNYNATFLHTDNNKGRFDVDTTDITKAFISTRTGDYVKNSYYYLSGFSGQYEELNHYINSVDSTNFYKNIYSGKDSYEPYKKTDSSDGDLIRVSKNAFESSKMGVRETVVNGTFFYKLLEKIDYYYELKNIINDPQTLYDLGRYATVFYKESADSKVVKEEYGRRLVERYEDGNGNWKYRFINPDNVIAKDRTKTEFPDYSNGEYYIIDSTTQSFIQIPGSQLENNPNKYKEIYVRTSKPTGFDTFYNKQLIGQPYQTEDVKNQIRKCTGSISGNVVWEFQTYVMGTFHYIDAGLASGEKIKYSDVEYQKLVDTKKDSYEYVGGGNEQYLANAFKYVGSNGSHNVEKFTYEENGQGKYNVGFKPSDNGEYGLIALNFVKTGGDHKAIEFEKVDSGGNYRISDYQFVSNGGLYKVKTYAPVANGEKGDFTISRYINSPTHTGDHHATNYIKDVGDFNIIYKPLTEKGYSKINVLEWNQVSSGDFISRGGSYERQDGGNLEKISTDESKFYYEESTPVSLEWNNITIQKGGAKDEKD